MGISGNNEIAKDFLANYFNYIFPENCLGEVFDGKLYNTPYGILKVFDNRALRFAARKEVIFQSFLRRDFYAKCPNLVPVNVLLYNGAKFYSSNFAGYIMQIPPMGVTLDVALKDKSVIEKLILLKKVENVIKFLHDERIVIPNLNETRIIVYNNEVYFMLNDDCCIYDRYRPIGMKLKYPCPYTKMLTKKSDIFVFRLMVVLALTGELNGKVEVYRFRKEVKKMNLPGDIKPKLLKIFNLKSCRNLDDYLF